MLRVVRFFLSAGAGVGSSALAVSFADRYATIVFAVAVVAVSGVDDAVEEDDVEPGTDEATNSDRRC